MLHPVSLEKLNKSKNILQSGLWGRIKSEYAWTAYGFIFNNLPLLVLIRTLPGGIKIAYIPHGPEVPMEMPFFTLFAQSLKSELPNVTFIRFDLPWQKNDAIQIKKPFRKPSVVVQPPDTVVINIEKSEEAILADMKKKTRYNIRLAEKKGVVVKQVGEEYLANWYELHQETAERDNIQIHSYDYYLTVFKECEKNIDTKPVLFCAYYEQKMIAGIFLVIYNDTATYLYGASSDSHRNVMPNYLLQWEAIRYAKQEGCKKYDMFGIPPQNDPSHPMYGLYRFKTGFGGEIIHMEGCWDYPVEKIKYAMYRTVESLRFVYYKKIKKR